MKENHMRPSKTLEKLRSGENAICTKMNLADPRAFEIAAICGFDCVWTCQEHIANDYRMINEQVLATKAHDCDILCRVAKGGYSDFIRPLELDATGIMVPHVMSLKEAEEVVEMTRFYPEGRRPVDGGNADGLYALCGFEEYMEQANRERFVVLQIEDPEPLDELDEIAALEGYDILFFGPTDFSHSIGDPGNYDNPLVKEARIKVADAANKYGKFAATSIPLSSYDEMLDLGYKFLSISADVRILALAYQNIIGTVKPLS